MIEPTTQIQLNSPEAEQLDIFVCGDDFIHFILSDKTNPLAEMCWTPEEAIEVAKKIEHAADVALGIA